MSLEYNLNLAAEYGLINAVMAHIINVSTEVKQIYGNKSRGTYCPVHFQEFSSRDNYIMTVKF